MCVCGYVCTQFRRGLWACECTRLHTLKKKKKSTINKLKKTNLFFLDLMLIALPYEHILGYCPGPWGWFRLSFGPHWGGLWNLAALGEAFKRPGGMLQPSLASHSGSGHLGRCPNLPLEVWTELGFTALFVSPEFKKVNMLLMALVAQFHRLSFWGYLIW